MKWKTSDASFESMRMLQERYALDRVSARILAGRGITEKEEVKFFLEKDISFLHNPFLFEDMELFCDRITGAAEEGEKVVIFGDRDVDGITSTALMVTELRQMGLDVTWKVPLEDEPYGVTKQNIDDAVADGITLAVTVDCGISAVDEIEYARKKGLDFLVTDHHIASEVLPPAHAIINPKVEGCGYPFSGLAGVGVAAKCIWALRFARTDLYRERFLLLHAYPGNQTIVIEACVMENLLVTDRICEEVVPGILPQENSRLLRFLNCGLPVMVLDSATEMNQLKKAFPKAEINLVDLRPQFESLMPSVKGKSLFDLSTHSRFALYSQTHSELDTLTGLFCAFVRLKYPSLYRDYAKLTDLVAIGTVSDLMPMLDENRIFVKNGLKQMEEGSRISMLPFLGLQKLLGKKLSATDIGWQISPYMNASGRMGEPQTAVNMLLCETREEAYPYAARLIELNRDRKKLGEDLWDRLLPNAGKSYEQFGSKFVLVRDNSIPRGITGIFATRLQKYFNAPSLVMTQTKDGRCMGSMRSPKTFNCHDFLSRYADLFEDFGGHAFAGGFSISPDRADELCIRISEDVDWLDIPDEADEEVLEIDAVLGKDDLTPEIMGIAERFEPYGEMNNQIQFMIEGARIENMATMENQKDPGNAHARFTLSFGSFKWPCVFWSCGRRAGRDFYDGSIVDAVFRVGRNNYRNMESIQLTICDIKTRM